MKSLKHRSPSTAALDRIAQLEAENRRLSNERAALANQLRDTARERDGLLDQLRAGRLMLDAALKGCETDCPHGREAAGLRIQLAAMQQRQDELQAANEGHESRGFVLIPEQTRRGRR